MLAPRPQNQREVKEMVKKTRAAAEEIQRYMDKAVAGLDAAIAEHEKMREVVELFGKKATLKQRVALLEKQVWSAQHVALNQAKNLVVLSAAVRLLGENEALKSEMDQRTKDMVDMVKVFLSARTIGKA